MPSVEAHVVSYNSAEVISDCLGSLLAHAPTDPTIDFSLAVLDNDSPDGTADLIAREFPAVRLVRSPVNTWYGPASNALVAGSDADFIFMINPDTHVTSDVVTPLVQALAADPSAAVAYPSITDSDGVIQPFSQQFPSLSYELALTLRGTKAAALLRPVWDADRVVRARRDRYPSPGRRPIPFVWSTAWLIRRDVAGSFGPFSPDFPMYDTDLDLCRRLADQGHQAIFVAGPSVAHLGGASSTPERKRAMERTARARYYRLHRGRAAEWGYRLAAVAVPAVIRAKRRVR